MDRFDFRAGPERVSEQAENAQEADARLERLRLLVVDEGANAREALARRFSHMRYDVILAEDGAAALGMLAAYRFDAVLVDMELTQPDGTETIRRMRVSGLLHGASVLSIAPQGDGSLALRALGAGADEHIAKPFDFDVLDLRVRHLVRAARRLEQMARHNDMLDARIARRARELGETRAELEELRADRGRLVSSIQALHDEISRLTGGGALH